MKEPKNSTLKSLSKLLEWSLHGVVWIAGSSILLTFGNRNTRYIAGNLLLGLLIDASIVGIMKITFARARPKQTKQGTIWDYYPDTYSFPSGHCSRTTMLLCYSLHFIPKSSYFPFNLPLLTLFSLSVPFSRVILDQHHPSDVIAGYLLGFVNYFVLSKLWLSIDDIENLLSIVNL